jgi:hypothetical protein
MIKKNFIKLSAQDSENIKITAEQKQILDSNAAGSLPVPAQARLLS